MPSLARFYGAPTPGRDAAGAGLTPPLPGAPPAAPANVDFSGTGGREPAPILIDVGANVGEVTARLMHLHTGLDCAVQQARHPATAPQPPCGAHDYDVRATAAGGGPVGAPAVWSFEALPATYERLVARGTAEGWPAAGWSAVLGAVGSEDGGVARLYSTGADGDRQATMSPEHITANGNFVEVPRVSLDGWAQREGYLAPAAAAGAAATATGAGAGAGVPLSAGRPRLVARRRIHMLKIDAEGFDPAVLDGAAGLLAAGAPSFLSFEYNDKWAWQGAGFTLPAAVGAARAAGYLCFLIVPDGLVPLSGGLWDPRLEVRVWSNVLCGRREDVAWAWPAGRGAAPVSALPRDGEPAPPAGWSLAASAPGVPSGRSHGPMRRVFDVLTDAGDGGPSSAGSVPPLPALPECAWAAM
jgi:hypothetical protein